MRARVPSVTVLLLVCLSAAFVGTARASSAPHASLLPGITGGYAYADDQHTSTGNTNTQNGPSYLASLGCAISNKTTTASAVSTQPGVLTSTGPVIDNATTNRTSTVATVQASADIQNVNIIGGLITATRANAVADSTATATTVSSSNMSTLVGLQVAGLPILLNPAPNTILPLPGVGNVTLNEQSIQSSGATMTRIAVTAIDVKVTLPNSFGLPVGTQIVIASAATSFIRTGTLASVEAGSTGLYVSGGSVPGSATNGPWAWAVIGCAGGSSQVSLNSGNLSKAGSTGTMADTANGQITTSSASAQSRSMVNQVNLLSQRITAASLIASAQASSAGSVSATTTLTNAKVAGVALQKNPRPNTRITIAGLGYVIVNEQSRIVTSTFILIQVNAFDLHVTTANSLGLPVGLDIIVGSADAVAATA